MLLYECAYCLYALHLDLFLFYILTLNNLERLHVDFCTYF